MGIYEHGRPGWGAFRQNKGVSGPNYIANPNVWIGGGRDNGDCDYKSQSGSVS